MDQGDWEGEDTLFLDFDFEGDADLEGEGEGREGECMSRKASPTL